MKLLIHKKRYYLLYLLIAVLLLLSVYNFIFINRILPGVYLNGINYGGLSYSQAVLKMGNELPKDTKITILAKGKIYDIPFNSIDLKYNKDTTYENLYRQGRQSIVSQLFYIPGFFIKKSDISFDYIINNLNLDLELATFSAQLFPDVKNAYFTYIDKSVVINEAGQGDIIDLSLLKTEILSKLKQGQTKYSAETTMFIPSVFKKDLDVIKPKVEELVSKKLILEYKGESYFPSETQIINFVDFDRKDKEIVAVTNSIEIENYVNDLASKINQEPKSVDFKLGENKEIAAFTPPANGRNLEKLETKKQIIEAILNYFNNNSELNTLSLNVVEVTPDPNSNEYGITELVAEGISYFAHSIPSRVSNIKTASDKINGTLVAPNEFYSFNDSVGPIDAENGFNSAYIISKGRTILGTGGGVCQVSSTVFRSALNGGFPITERTAHAYRVSYYEQNSEIGYDATIFQPSVDFKFKNDTEHYILVTSEVDTTNMKMWVRIYGTKDGRTVEVTKPKLGPQIKPPETVYEDDSSLPKGQLVQIEYPAYGGTSVFKQIVKNKDGSTRFEQEFKSYYRPWAAVFKKGTKD